MSPTLNAAPVSRASLCDTHGCVSVTPENKRVALVFSAYPTKHARIGNAVGLDTPASAVALLRAMRDGGYDIGDIPGVDAEDGDALVHALIERGGQDPDWLTEGQLAGNPIRVPANDYRAWFATLPAELDRCRGRALGSSTGRAVRRPQHAIQKARSSSRQCSPATSC